MPLIWQGDSSNVSPNYSGRRGLIGSLSSGIPQTAFQGVELEVGALPTAYQSQFLPIYNDLIDDPSPVQLSGVFVPTSTGYNLIADVQLESNLDYSNNKLVYIITRHQTDEYFCSVVAYGDMDLPISTAGQSGSYNMELAVNQAWDPETLQGYILVQSFDTTYPYIYQAAECGTSPVTTTSMNFGDSYIGGNFEKKFKVINISDNNANFVLSLIGDGYTLTDPTTLSLNAGEQYEYTVTFTPTAEMQYPGVIMVSSDISGFEYSEIALDGTGFVDQAPSAELVTLTGMAMQNDFLTASYTFLDMDGDMEGDTEVKWYKSQDGDNWEEFNHNSNDPMIMQIGAEYIGYMIKFTVLPIDEHSMPGTLVESNTSSVIIPLQAPWGLDFTSENGNDIVLTWENPLTDQRALFGYRVFRNGVSHATLPNSNTLTYTDVAVEDGTWEYYVRAIYNNPLTTSEPSNTITVVIEDGLVGNNENVATLNNTLSVSPNPFSESSNLSFSLKSADDVRVDIYNVRGQLVNTLVNSNLSQGEHTIQWNGTDARNNKVSNGIYFYKITASDYNRSMKTIYMK